MMPRVVKSGIPYNEKNLAKVKELAEQERLDYYQIVYYVEAIF